jgi:phosphatidylserine/phosphatidylglycerophosphate/cardiolipin synthase-like enzyme
LALCFIAVTAQASLGLPTPKQKSLDEWRSLTASNAPIPRVFVKGDTVHFFFPAATNSIGFGGHWGRLRVPTKAYRINSALLRWEQGLTRVPAGHGWREATVIAGDDWRQLVTNLVAALTPATPGHGIYYQGFLADRFWYRDTNGAARSATTSEPRKEIIMDRRFSGDETIENLARLVDAHLSTTHPGHSLFLLMPPHSTRFTQPLLLDRQRRQCVRLSPAALYDTTERGLALTATVRGAEAFLLESHGLALVKNPVSSVARLADLAVHTVLRFFRLPLPRTRKPTEAAGTVPAPDSHQETTQRVEGGMGAPCKGMDLVEWESWLDRYTGTRRQAGSLELLLDGERFFPRLTGAINEATNHIRFNVYIFDRDDIGVEMADRLKHKAKQVEVQVILDRMGSMAAGLVPPATPLPEDFVPPASITSYLKRDPAVQVRHSLNPWFSADHTKLMIVDGWRAWLGGMNIGREYRYEWHDLMVEVQGPVVATLEDEFRRDWAHAGMLGDLAYFSALLTTPDRSKRAPNDLKGTVRLLPTKTGWKPFANAVFGSLRRAQQCIYVENPYLFDKKVVRGLVLARRRGVDVRVVLPRVNDLKAGGRGNLVTANYLLQNGVRVYFYPGMTHVKAMLVDGWACVGSGNLNHLSLRLCQEHNVATSDPGFAQHLKHELFEEDFLHSYELTEPISVDWMDVVADVVLESF